MHLLLNVITSYSIHYTKLYDIGEDNILSKIETFGPILPILKVKDSEEAVAIANNSKYGLQAGVFTNDINKAMKIADSLEYGGIMINSSPTFRKDNMPFGGVKKSGLGREGIRITSYNVCYTKLLRKPFLLHLSEYLNCYCYP